MSVRRNHSVQSGTGRQALALALAVAVGVAVAVAVDLLLAATAVVHSYLYTQFNPKINTSISINSRSWIKITHILHANKQQVGIDHHGAPHTVTVPVAEDEKTESTTSL